MTRFDPKVLGKYRKLLFPVIGNGALTGYNVYKNRKGSKSPYEVCYFHSDLGVKKGEEQTHGKSLSEKLQERGFQKRKSIVTSTIDRVAAYKSGNWKENPPGLRYYNSQGDRVPKNKMDQHKGLIIVEGLQYEHILKLGSLRRVNEVLDFFKRIVFLFETDIDGHPVRPLSSNREAIHGSWEIPLITVKGPEFSRRDYTPVTEFDILDKNYSVSMFVDRRKRLLERKFSQIGIGYETSTLDASRGFVDLYLNSQ